MKRGQPPSETEQGEPQKRSKLNGGSIEKLERLWEPNEVLGREFNIDLNISSTVCHLLDEGNSIPFLARYRREMTGGMDPDTLRKFKDSFDTLKSVQEKCCKLVAAVEKAGKLTPSVKRAFLWAQSLPELEHTYAPFKTGSKATLAERARALGLEGTAVEILEGRRSFFDLTLLIDKKTPGKTKLEEIENGVQHIIADIIVHDKDTCDLIRDLQHKAHIVIESKQAKPKTGAKVNDKKESAPKKKVGVKEDNPAKFQNYFDFSCPLRFIKSHQILAMNRGESLKILTVKVNLPDAWLNTQLENHVRFRFLRLGTQSQLRQKLVSESLKDAYKRLISPMMIRNVRSELLKVAEEAAIQSFAENLRKLLLTPPFRGKRLLSIDPGFAHGCKIAVISESGEVLDTGVVYPRFRDFYSDSGVVKKLTETIKKFSISFIGIGNGKACREVQGLISEAIANKFFPTELGVKYVIVEERGASIYSCSPLAAEEFPGMDTNIVSAISIGRRLQDPLSEYVKIEPSHLGVGMYQHDLPQTKLKTALDEIVTECVSFVGVDLNSCSEHLLRRVAGLTPTRAKAIVEFRKKNDGFSCRDDLKKVKGIGEKVFTQCSGFIRIRLIGSDKSKTNTLDATSIHPESYKVAKALIKKAGCDGLIIGEPAFIDRIKNLANKSDPQNLAKELQVGVPTLALILEALQKDLEHDYRDEFEAPLFRSGVTRLEDVSPGTVLTGRVSNVTDFAAFIDIGLGIDGFLHVSKMRGNKVELGQRVEVKLISKDVDKGRIGLDLLRIM